MKRYLPTRKIGEIDSYFVPYVRELQGHLNNLSQFDDYSRSLSRSVPGGEVSITRLKGMMDIVKASFRGGGNAFFLHKERGVAYIYDYKDSAFIRRFPLASPFDWGWTPDEITEFRNYFDEIYRDSNYWDLIIYAGIPLTSYSDHGDKSGCSVFIAKPFLGYSGGPPIGTRYDYSGNIDYSLRLDEDETFKVLYWGTRHTKDNKYWIEIGSYRYHYTYPPNPDYGWDVCYYLLFIYKREGKSDTYIATILTDYGGLVRTEIDCIDMEDDFFYVHLIDSQVGDPPNQNIVVPSSVYHYIRKYDYTGALLGESEKVLSNPLDTVIAWTIRQYEAQANPHFYDGDIFDRSGNILYSSKDYIVYSCKHGRFRCSWNAKDLTYRAGAVSTQNHYGSFRFHLNMGFVDNILCENDSSKTFTGTYKIDDFIKQYIYTYDYDKVKPNEAPDDTKYDNEYLIPQQGILDYYYREALYPGFVLKQMDL